MSAESEQLIAKLRSDPVDFTADLDVLRARFSGLAAPLDGAGVSVRDTVIGGVPVQEIVPPTASGGAGVVVFVHAGGFIAGSAAASSPLAARLAVACGRRVLSVDYALAPEHPFPAARDQLAAVMAAVRADGGEPSSVALVGASAGAGIALQYLASQPSASGAQPPVGALVLLSPFVDLELSGDTMTTNAAIDPSLTPAGLARCAGDYLAGLPATDVDVLGVDLSALPRTLIQVGGLEILLDDSVRLASRLAHQGVDVRLECWAGMVHVFPTFAGVLPEGREAIARIGAFVRESRVAA